MTTSSRPRLGGIDALRGVFACGIMIYHLLTWTQVALEPWLQSLMTAVGIYFVDYFFVISGASLFYSARDQNWRSAATVAAFAVRRVFRIYPLYWAATVLTVLLSALAGDVPIHRAWAVVKLMLVNGGLLFGFWDAGKAIPVGGWSLGLEIVYYALFPLIMLAAGAARWRILGLALLAVALGVAANHGLDASQTLASQWRDYVRPWHHGAFFVTGMALAAFAAAAHTSLARLAPVSGLLGIVVFAGLAVSQSSVPGAPLIAPGLRLGMLAAGLLMAWAVLLGSGKRAPLLGSLQKFLGETSFGVYLVHPLMWQACRVLGVPSIAAAALTVILTPAVAWLAYRWVERPMIDRGRGVAARVGLGFEQRSAHR